MSGQSPDSGIPVLTEVLKTLVYGVDLPERRATAAVPVPVPVPASEPRPPQVAILDTVRLEHEVGDAVMRELLGRIDLVLENRIRDSLADTLQTAVDGLACQLRHGLKEMLAQVVAQAVEQAVAQASVQAAQQVDVLDTQTSPLSKVQG